MGEVLGSLPWPCSDTPTAKSLAVQLEVRPSALEQKTAENTIVRSASQGIRRFFGSISSLTCSQETSRDRSVEIMTSASYLLFVREM